MAVFYHMQISKFLLSKNIQIQSLYDTFQLRNIEWTTTSSLSKEYNTDVLSLPVKIVTFNYTNQERFEHLLGSEIYCVSEGLASPPSVLVILIT